MTTMTEPRRRQFSSHALSALQARWRAAYTQWRAVQACQAAHKAQHRARMALLRRHMPEANPLTLDITAAILTARALLGARPRPASQRPRVVCADAAQAFCGQAEGLRKTRAQRHSLEGDTGELSSAAD